MPFSNPYNARIKDKLKNMAYAKAAHLNQIQTIQLRSKHQVNRII